MRKKIWLALLCWVSFSVGLQGCTVVKPGESGVVFNRWFGTLTAVGQGTIMYVPIVSTVQPYPVALRTYSMVQRSGEGSSTNDDSIDLPSKEGQHIKLDISITYNTSPDKAAYVYKSFNGSGIEDIENTFVRRTIITVAQNAAGSMALVELISTKRDELQQNIQNHLSEELLRRGFTLDKVNLGASHLPASVEQQMQEKMAAQQQAQRADYELQKQQTLAKAEVAKAEGIAKANAILQQSLTTAILEKIKLDKWDGKLSQVVAGNGGIMVNIGPHEAAAK